MATAWVEVRDNSIWFKHISGPHLLKRLEALAPDEAVRLRIAGKVGLWRRMKAQKHSGAPTPALKPGDEETCVLWNSVYGARRGEHLEIEIVESVPSPQPRPVRMSDGERDAAWATFLQLTHAGWEAGAPLTRDDLHERN